MRSEKKISETSKILLVLLYRVAFRSRLSAALSRTLRTHHPIRGKLAAGAVNYTEGQCESQYLLPTLSQKEGGFARLARHNIGFLDEEYDLLVKT